jgi:type II secretory pathway component PulF
MAGITEIMSMFGQQPAGQPSMMEQIKQAGESFGAMHGMLQQIAENQITVIRNQETILAALEDIKNVGRGDHHTA